MKSLYAYSFKDLKDRLNQLSSQEEVKSVLLLIADNNRVSEDELTVLLSGFSKPLIGGVFPELIYQGKRIREGSLLIPLTVTLETAVIDLSENNGDLPTLLQNNFSHKNDIRRNLLLFVDAFADQKSQFIQSLYNFFGGTVNYLGGGAGSLSFNSFECIIHNSGVYKNAAVMGLFVGPLALGVAHGWSPISNPMKITETSGNKIVSIDWEPAFEVYKKWVESHSGEKIAEDNFFEIAKSYPLGMLKLDSEMVIRDPYLAKNNYLYILDEIPDGEYVSIMHGDMESLLKGASNALRNSEKSEINNILGKKFCIDCISRVLYMQDDYERELDIIDDQNKLDGILSIGEIANSGETFLEMYNKTIVVAQW